MVVKRVKASKRQSVSKANPKPRTIQVGFVDYENVAFYWEISPDAREAEKRYVEMYSQGMRRLHVDAELEQV
jgi:hypothetical protein